MQNVDIDTVKIVREGLTVSELTLDQYLELPLRDKIQGLLAGDFLFFSGGEEIPSSVAVGTLKPAATT